MSKLKGSYTVEAACVFSICFLIIGSVICLTFSIYKESINYVGDHKVKTENAVRSFRRIDAIKDLSLDELTNQ
ncbi:MAG: hypothetical protein K6F00_03695 [Lachnospiraceae bacterium]|nr:hypothetical protein [Lachnospiraceae bacterium]